MRDAFDIDWRSRNHVVVLWACIEGLRWAILGADQLVTPNASCTTTFSLANGRGVWPTGQFPPYAEDFFVYTWDGAKAKNFTIDHNLSCFGGPAESDVLCAWSRDFGMRVDDGHRFLHHVVYSTEPLLTVAKDISIDYNTY